MSSGSSSHLLRELTFPARYEALVASLGPQLASVLVDPAPSTAMTVEDAASGVAARGEGLFMPLVARSGTGKTTLANNLGVFFPDQFLPTLQLETTMVDAEALRTAVEKHVAKFSASNDKLVPINIDNREGAAPSSQELASIKRFLRMPNTGARSVILWPDTSPGLAAQMAAGYTQIAGASPIPIPVEIAGPPIETWSDIAKHTLKLANGIDSLETIGVNPDDYAADDFHSIGDYLRKLSDDFTAMRLDFLRSTRKPLRLAVVVASESSDAGVLTHLTSSRFGLLDGSALLDASPDSEVGRWWGARRGLLTQSIVRLDARVFGLPPSASIHLLRRYGPQDVRDFLKELGVGDPGQATISRNLGRSDLGKYLEGQDKSTFETKGTPTTTSLAAFQYLGQRGFTSGRDKALNGAVAGALEHYCGTKGLEASVNAEKRLSFCPLIPDNALEFEDAVTCVEYTWRASDYLTAKNRGNIAKYCLEKLRSYSRELGWVASGV